MEGVCAQGKCVRVSVCLFVFVCVCLCMYVFRMCVCVSTLMFASGAEITTAGGTTYIDTPIHQQSHKNIHLDPYTNTHTSKYE